MVRKEGTVQIIGNWVNRHEPVIVVDENEKRRLIVVIPGPKQIEPKAKAKP